MQSAPRLHPAATFALFVACPLLSAVTLAGIAVGFATALDAAHVFAIGAAVAAGAFVVNAAALCMAVTRREDDERACAFDALETTAVAPAHARAS